jgi:hypothetical protein
MQFHRNKSIQQAEISMFNAQKSVQLEKEKALVREPFPIHNVASKCQKKHGVNGMIRS